MKRTEDSLRDLWDNIKHANIRIIGVPEEEEKKKGTEKILEVIIVKNFPNTGKEIVNQVQEVQRVPYRINPRRNTPRHILIKLSKINTKKRILKAAREGFPGGAVVENLPANAGDTGSSTGLGGSRMPRSNWAREPQLLSLHVRSLCSATGEAAIVRGPRTTMKSGPRLPQLEKALTQK